MGVTVLHEACAVCVEIFARKLYLLGTVVWFMALPQRIVCPPTVMKDLQPDFGKLVEEGTADLSTDGMFSIITILQSILAMFSFTSNNPMFKKVVRHDLLLCIKGSLDRQ